MTFVAIGRVRQRKKILELVKRLICELNELSVRKRHLQASYYTTILLSFHATVIWWKDITYMKINIILSSQHIMLTSHEISHPNITMFFLLLLSCH